MSESNEYKNLGPPIVPSTMTPTLLNIRPVFHFIAVAFCLHHTACLSSGSDTWASTQVATATAHSGGQVPQEQPTGILQSGSLMRFTRNTHQHCAYGNSIPTGESQSVITTTYYSAQFFIYPKEDFKGIKILLHGKTVNSTLEYPKDIICLNESRKWYNVDINIPYKFVDNKAAPELTTNFCCIKCITEIENEFGFDIKGMEVVVVGASNWTTYETPDCDLQPTISCQTSSLVAEYCEHSIDLNSTFPSSTTTTTTPHRSSTTTTTTPHRSSNTTATPYKSPTTTTQAKEYLILILVVVGLVLLVAVVLIVVMVVRRKRSSRGEHKVRLGQVRSCLDCVRLN